MDRALTYHVLDVFTEAPYAGNPLAVVLGADGLTDRQMQTMAREFNLSETIFVQSPQDPSHTARVRIFFPTAEIPFAGHPTLGCAVLLAELAHGPGDWQAEVTLEEVAGLVPVRLQRSGGVTSGTFRAPVLPHAAEGAAPPDLCAQAVGLPPLALSLCGFRPGVWQGGPRFLFLPVATRADLASARPMEPAWSELIAQAGVDSAWLFAPGDGADYQARMFSPTAGIPEDPATGSATAIFAAALLAAGEVSDGETRLTVRQGVEMGRPSSLALTIRAAAGALTTVEIGGAAVRVAEGRITPP
jgi:trans-2,3-dihydro-3-hydroxyanthranilate isomerase